MTDLAQASAGMLSGLLQQGPADTFDYMVLGFGVILGVMALYVIILILRFRNARRDREVLQEILEEKT